MPAFHSASGSVAEELFIELFSETFGAEKAGYLYSQYHFYDIYQNSRYADFVLENGSRRVAIEIDDETSHSKSLVASSKFYDDLLKQNSMVYLGWDVYRWAVRQMQIQPEAVKDELRVFLGSHPHFKEIEDYLPPQRGKALDGTYLELKKHQLEALKSLQAMRDNRETIALLYHATGTGKTVTAVMDAKNFGGRTLFLAHTQELINQAAETFRKLWPSVTVGRYMESIKQPGAHMVCSSVQSVALHLKQFKDDGFDYLIVDEAHHASADTYQKVLSYFKPSFTLGLTATPERTDDNSQWEGYLRGPTENKRLTKLLEGRISEPLHTSGHATAETLREVYNAVKPACGVFPIHSEQPEKFQEILPDANVQLLTDGKTMTL